MTAGAATDKGASGSRGLGVPGTVLFFILVLGGVFYFYSRFFDSGYLGDILWWRLGTVWLLFWVGLYVLVWLSPDKRRFGLFLYIVFLLTIVVGAFIQSQIRGDPEVARFIQNSALLSSLVGGYFESVVWSFVLGFLIALGLTLLPLLLFSSIAADYVLALHHIEGVGYTDAVRHLLMPSLGIKLPYMVVEEGQALITQEAGALAVIGGPGELIVKQGNVVVLERGGVITRIVKAGVTQLQPLETIRNIFVLDPQTRSAEIEHVLTKDRIPLKIRLAIKIQIEPAAEVEKRPASFMPPHGEALTEKLDDGLYQVYEGTVRKAALLSQATTVAKREFTKCDEEQVCQDVEETTWQKAAGSLPEAELRDHIMSHRFDELFELVDSLPGEKPEVRANKRKIYEIEQAILEVIRSTRIKVLGVLVRAVDIGKIEFPDGVEQLLLKNWWAPMVASETNARNAELEAQAIVTRARAKAQATILEGQGEAEARAAVFREILREMRREGVLGDEEMIAHVLRQLINTMVTLKDLEAYIKLAGLLERLSRQQVEIGSEDAQSNGKGGIAS